MNLLDLAVKISVDDKATGKVSGVASNIKSKLSEAAAGASKMAASATKATAAAAAAAAAAIAAATAAMVKSSIDAYATYEQQVGGIAKLYGNAGQSLEDYAAAQGASVDAVQAKWEANEAAQATVMANARKAWRTTGQSANDYMETATQFSASLITSLGGDTQKAADMTDVAMRAMSDNVNTFGSDFESVSDAFKGFSKQNYTMLDNLKLGYGGTKEEMERLIKDANEYRASIGESSDLTIDSFADIVQAVESIQEKMQIAGTTGLEAMSTIEGSTGAAKAAWANFATAVSSGDTDLRESFGYVNEGMLAVASNVVPAFTRVLDNVGYLFSTGFPVTLANIQYLIETYGPQIGESFGNLFSGVGTFIQESGPGIANYVGSMLGSAITTAVPAAAEAIPGALETLGNLASSFLEGLLPDSLGTPIAHVITVLTEDIGKAWGSAADVAEESAGPAVDILTVAFQALDAVVTPLGDAIATLAGIISDILVSAIKGLTGMADDDIPDLGTAFTTFRDNATQAVDDIAEKAAPFVSALCTGLENVGTAFDNLKTAVQPVIDTVTDFFDGVVSGAQAKFESDLQPALENLAGAWEKLQEACAPIADTLGGIIGKLAGDAGDSVAGAMQSASDNAGTAGETFGGSFVEGLAGALNTIAAIIEGVAGIITTIQSFVDKVGQVPEDIAGAIEEWKGKFEDLKTHVSTKFEEIKTKIGEFVQDLPDKAREAGQGFLDGLKGKFEEAVEWVKGVPQMIKDAIANAPASLFEAGQGLMQGFWDGLQSIGASVTEWASGVADQIAAVKGPLWYDRIVLIPNGKAIMEGFQAGLSSGLGGVLSEVSTYADEIAGAASVKVAPSVDFDSLGVKGGFGEVDGGALTVYNVQINDARVNQDVAQLTGDYLLELSRIGAL